MLYSHFRRALLMDDEPKMEEVQKLPRCKAIGLCPVPLFGSRAAEAGLVSGAAFGGAGACTNPVLIA